MNLKIKIYCILLTAVYIAILTSSLYYGRADFLRGFEEASRNSINSNDVSEIFYIDVEPQNGKYSFPEFIENKKTNKNIEAEISQYVIKIENPSATLPTYLRVINIICWVVLPFLAIAVLLSPILFFSVIYSVSKNRIITDSLITRIQILGWLILLFSAFEFIYIINNTLIVKHYVELSIYNIGFDRLDYMMLVLSLVTLLLAEILKVSLKMKEEQDLTI